MANEMEMRRKAGCEIDGLCTAVVCLSLHIKKNKTLSHSRLNALLDNVRQEVKITYEKISKVYDEKNILHKKVQDMKEDLLNYKLQLHISTRMADELDSELQISRHKILHFGKTLDRVNMENMNLKKEAEELCSRVTILRKFQEIEIEKQRSARARECQSQSCQKEKNRHRKYIADLEEKQKEYQNKMIENNLKQEKEIQEKERHLYKLNVQLQESLKSNSENNKIITSNKRTSDNQNAEIELLRHHIKDLEIKQDSSIVKENENSIMFERSEVFEKKTVEPCDEKLLEEIQTILTSLYDIDKQLTGVLLSLKIDTNITQEQELCTEDQNKHPKWMECERKKLVNMVKYKLELLHKHVSKDQVVFENYNFSGESFIKQNENRNTEEDLNEKQMERTQPITETKLPVSVSNTNVNKNNLDRFTGSKLYLKQNAENTAVDKKVLKDEFRKLKDVALEKHSGMYLLESKSNEPEKEHENLKNESKINVQVDINKELLNQNLTEKEADYLNNITNLTKNLAEAEALVSQLNDKLSSREADLDNRTKEMLNLKQTLTESEEQCNIMKNELFQQKTRIESLVGELEEKIADLRIRNTQHVHMLRKLKEYDDTVKLIGKEKQKLESNAIDNKGRIDEIERNFENKNKHLMHLNECNARLVVEKDKEISVLNELLKQCNNESSDLSKTIDTLSLNIQDKNDQLKQCTQLLNKSESNVREMDISLQTAQAQFEKDLDNMKEVNREKDHLIVKLNEKLAVMEARVKALENEVKGKNDEKIELNAQLQQCLNINDERQLKFEEMVSSKEMYILDLKKEAEQRKTEIHNLKKKLVHESSKKEQTLNVAEKNEIRELKNQLNHALSKLHATESELDDTKTRLSKTMGDRLTDNNPSITDLSDRNRPTKLAEKYSELYDNQWTDAFEILEKYFPNDEGVIETLLHILQETIKFCVNQSQNQMEELGRTLNLADKQEQVVLPVGVLKKLKDIRKAMSISTVGNVRKIFMEYLRQSSDQTIIKALETHEFTFECLEMCWLMMVNDPPVVFAPLLEKGTSFNTDLYKTYTTSGTHVEFVVWPALLLHEGGPVLAKGVAQGFNKSTKTMTKI